METHTGLTSHHRYSIQGLETAKFHGSICAMPDVEVSMFSSKIFSQGGKQIVSATDRPVREVSSLTPKLLTYFATRNKGCPYLFIYATQLDLAVHMRSIFGITDACGNDH